MIEKYSDLVADHLLENGILPDNGDSKITKGKYNLIIEEYEIKTIKISQKLQKPLGIYTLLTLKDILSDNKDLEKYYLQQFVKVLKKYLKLNKNSVVLVVGLGNRHISSDSLGTEVVKNIIITRNFCDNSPQICAFAPSVMGLTGIESADIIDGIVSKIKPDYVIMIDSLCASDVSRLGVSFQVSNTPITPGSGIGNTRKKISSKISTISIGVPLVVYSNTYIKSAIKNADIDIDNISDKVLRSKLYSIIKTDSNELVTPSEIEYIVDKIGKFIAKALNIVFMEE